MIHILFVPGSFGSTVQYLIRQFNTELSNHKILYHADDLILLDGSMHSFLKTGHYRTIKEIEDYFNNKIDQDIIISSPIYPMPDAHADTIINLFQKYRPQDKYIFIWVANIDQAEITLLAQYYKIFIGTNTTIGTVCGDNQHNIVNWNADYTHWNQMQIWELREWFSIFYPVWVQEWIDAKQYVPPNWLCVSSKDILENTNDTIIDIINHAGEFNFNLKNEFDDFITIWKLKQQYLIDEHNTIKNIVKSIITNTLYTWTKLNILSEAMVQKRLRDEGFEIKCYNLNTFPTNSIELYQLLDRI